MFGIQKPKRYKLILFDLDRTLWDYETNAIQTLSELYRHFDVQKYEMTLDNFLIGFKKFNDILWNEFQKGNIDKQSLREQRFTKVLESVGVKDRTKGIAMDQYYIEEAPKQTEVFPGTIEILEYLKQRGYALSLLTNGFTEVQVVKIDRCGIAPYFDRMFTSQDVGFQKPDSRIFHAAITAHHARKKDVLMVGDDWENDIIGARNYGIDSAFFCPNGKPIELDFNPTYCIERLLELQKFL